MLSPRRRILGAAILIGGVGLLLFLRLFVGRTITPDGAVEIAFGLPDASVLAIRIGSSIAAIAAGSALALSGLAFQVLLRNPLASPWVLGVSSGA
ncbi:MAG TPA: ABC transporter permease, partial [Phycisphaerales bacterium]|nr:ABC transporter permease [Phycisphaerales bacterium]